MLTIAYIILSLSSLAWAGDYCVYDVDGSYETIYCSTGCCKQYETTSPCCFIRLSAGIIVAIVVGAVAFIGLVIASIICRRRYYHSVTHVTQPASQPIIVTSNTVQSFEGPPPPYVRL